MTFFVSTIPFYPLYKIAPSLARKIVSYIIAFHAKVFLLVLGAQINVKGDLTRQSGQLIIANHMSYLDILVVLSQIRTSFITSYEIKETPFLGSIADLAGSFYTERRNKENLKKEVAVIKEALKDGASITFFPEATSTNAEEIKRFRKPFFYPAFELKKPVTTLTINYLSINQKTFSLKNRDLVCWYGEMSFFPHFWKLMSINSLKVDIIVKDVAPERTIEDTVFVCQKTVKENFNSVASL